ncbi:MAG: FAD-binding protein [Planctomycetota bacterium]|nr:MAG: FAD-binding protein [Planctomycetota bacterium]
MSQKRNSQGVDQKIDALAARIAQSSGPLLVRGGCSKPALSLHRATAEIIQRDALPAGIVAYDPSEFLITAWAGTPVAELQRATAEHGQYLPFDPLFANDGATLGGTIAAGISGPNQLLHGRIRDFVMEVECIDGRGNRVRGGGKVVKNAAGFDLPKLMVGSYGRLGVITEATLKVLPCPPAMRTVVARCQDASAALQAMQTLGSQPLPLAATEYLPDGRLLLRFAGPQASLPRVVDRAEHLLQQELDELEQEQAQWASPPWLNTVNAEYLLYVVHSPNQMPPLINALQERLGLDLRSVTAHGTASWWVADQQDDLPGIDERLREHRAAGVVVRGPVDALTLLGELPWLSLSRRIGRAIDPRGVFPQFIDGSLDSPAVGAKS